MRRAFYETIACVPYGKVATYGQIATLAGYPGRARQVGFALAGMPGESDLPWHRIINAQGKVSPRSGSSHLVQYELLASEGIVFTAQRINLKRFGWRPEAGGLNSLDRRIFGLAIPSILSALSTPLIGIADTAMIGHLPEVAFMGAVSTASLIFNGIFWCLAFLRMGTTALVAQYSGAGDRRQSAGVLYRSLIVAVCLGMGIVAAGDWISRIGFELAGGSPQVQHWGLRYFAIRVWEAPLALSVMTLNGFFLGTANAIAPLWITTVANLVNIGADYVLIYGKLGAPKLGVEGAAWASVLGNATALATGVFLLLRWLPLLSAGVADKAVEFGAR